MHILIVLHDFSVGGTERIALRLAQEWTEAGEVVSILCGSQTGGYRASVAAGIQVRELTPSVPRAFLSRIKLARALPDAIDAISPDIIFLPGNFHLVLARVTARCRSAPPVVAKLSNPVRSRSKLWPIRWLAKQGFAHFAKKVTVLVGMSRGIADDARAAVSGPSVRFIPDPNLDETNYATSTRGFGLSAAATPKILAAGRLVPQKDFALAIRSLAALLRSRPARLVIQGNGPLGPSLRRLCRRLGVTEWVEFVEHASTIVPMLDAADLLLVTSKFEGGPAVAVEALAAGRPVVATDCSYCLRDVLAEPECGMIVKDRSAETIAQAISAVLDQRPPQRSILIKAVREYRADRSAQAYLHLFRQQLGSRL